MTPEELERLYLKLDGMVVALDKDPTTRGPAYLQGKISEVREHLNDVGVELQKVARIRRGVQRQLQIRRAEYAAEYDKWLATDPTVKQLPSVGDRKAYINVKLAENVKELSRLELQDSDLEKTLKFRHSELQDTMSAIRLHRSLIDSELLTKSYLGGSSTREDGGAPQDSAEDEDQVTLDNILAALDKGPPEEDISLDGIPLMVAPREDVGPVRLADGNIKDCRMASTGSAAGCPSCSGRCPDHDRLSGEIQQEGAAAKAGVSLDAALPPSFGTSVSEDDLQDFLSTSNFF
jgi:hypothetical protein